MPTEILSYKEKETYGCFEAELREAELHLYFHFSDTDLWLIRERYGSTNQFGFALQLGSVRCLGNFLFDFEHIPSSIVECIANQLSITPCQELLHAYGANKSTRSDHTKIIKDKYKYREFGEQPDYFRFIQWLYNRLWFTEERLVEIMNAVRERLILKRILLPGVTTLERLIGRVKERVNDNVCRKLIKPLTAFQSAHLTTLLSSAEGSSVTTLQLLRTPPSQSTVKGIIQALERLQMIRKLGIPSSLTKGIPPARIRSFARIVTTASVHSLSRIAEPRRSALLVAWITVTLVTAQDDVIDIFDQLIGTLLGRAERRGTKNRFHTLKLLDKAAQKLCLACSYIVNDAIPERELKEKIFSDVSKAELLKAVYTVSELTKSDDDWYVEQLSRHYPVLRRFLPLFLRTISFHSNETGQDIIQALKVLPLIEHSKRRYFHEQEFLFRIPLSFIPKSWHHLIFDAKNRIDKRYYTLCVLAQLRGGLRKRDIFLESSERWHDPNARLITHKEWESKRNSFIATLDKNTSVDAELHLLEQRLDEAFATTEKGLPHNPALRIFNDALSVQKEYFSLAKLDETPEAESLVILRESVASLLPSVELPEILWEIHSKTHFADEFTHVSDEKTRITDLPLSICAVLIAESCNIGLEPLIRSDHPALNRARLEWVQQHYLRADTIRAANNRLLETQTHIPLAQAWGGGEVASADGLRFVVPVRTINAGPNPKYFGYGRGLTYYNYTSDQFTGFHSIVIPGTLRDSLFILEGLLEHDRVLKPKELMTDTAGYSDVVFGLFWLLGFRFSPRLADITDQRFWKMSDKQYGKIDFLPQNRIRTKLIRENWDDMLRLTASLKSLTVRASDIMRTLQSGSGQTTLAKAIAEVGKIEKTIYLLNYLHDEAYRRRILIQLNRGESRHALARSVYHGQRGEMRKRYREGQEDQLSALGLVVNAIVLWNTLYMDQALHALQQQCTIPVHEADILRLSPLLSSHINLLGRYSFQQDVALGDGVFRPLRFRT
jgi:TnpA family transposase